MGMIRDVTDLKAVLSDQQRAAQAGGPRQYAKFPGRPRGADRFPSAKSGQRAFRKSSKR
jgi:hypothetical protein